MKLLGLLLLLSPMPRLGLAVLEIDILVIVDQFLDGVLRELEGDLMGEYKVDMDDMGLDVEELISEEGIDDRVFVLLDFGFRGTLHQQ